MVGLQQSKQNTIYLRLVFIDLINWNLNKILVQVIYLII